MTERGTDFAELNVLTNRVIGAAIEVHRLLGPGLLEAAYEECLCRELALQDLPFRRQLALPVDYKGLLLDCSYRLDLLVADSIVVEAKALSVIQPIHEAQLLTYMKLGGWRIGLLINSTLPSSDAGSGAAFCDVRLCIISPP